MMTQMTLKKKLFEAASPGKAPVAVVMLLIARQVISQVYNLSDT